MAEFFLVSLPGLEDLALDEVKAWFPHFEGAIEYGGVTVHAPLAEGLSMNQALKIPTRILLRITSFRCRDFPKYFNRIAEFGWEKWLDPSCEIEAFAASRKSRLKIKSRIEETFVEGWKAFQKRRDVTVDAEKKAKVYIRFAQDECTLSLDTSGDRLHKRGLRRHIGEAPLRETIAAAILQMLARHSTDGLGVELVDPMMGSATFFLEALGRDRLVESRDFAFERFASRPQTAPKLQASRAAIRRLVGFETDKKTIEAARHNLSLVGADALSFADIHEQDFFSAKPLPAAGASRWVVCNPPYGERLKIDARLKDYYEKLFDQAEKVIRPNLAGFLLPAVAVKGKFVLPPTWQVLEKRPFLNGGLPVVAFVFGRRGFTAE
jgi:putative N6-adenine-specific DNA methylase